MTTFRYKAINNEGKKVSGVIKAEDEYEAAATLKETCSVITKMDAVVEDKKPLFTATGSSKNVSISDKELAMMCSQFSIILSSGLSVVRCVEMVAAQTKNKQVKEMLLLVAQDISGGMTMADSFQTNAPKLPTTFIETIRAGEEAGTMDQCFKRLQQYFDKSSKTKSKVVSALAYPAIVIVVAIVVFVIIMVVAVPLFTETFADLGTELPMITKIIMGMSDFFTGYWWVLLIIAAAFVAARAACLMSESGKLLWGSFQLKYFPLHGIREVNASAQFASTMATMLSAGIPIIKALEITADVMSNTAMKISVKKVHDKVEQGGGIAETMAKIDFFPTLLTEMTGVGEESGTLETTLDVVATYYDNEAEISTNRILTIMEPAITIGLAVVTVILLLAVYLPMFSMYSSVGI